MSQVVVRRATLGDVEGILPLWKEMMDYHARLDARIRLAPGCDEHWVSFLMDLLNDEKACVLVACITERIVGYIIGMIREKPPVLLPAIYGFVSDICVDPGWRRQGVGRKLFEALKVSGYHDATFKSKAMLPRAR